MRKSIRKISLAMAVLSVFAVFGSACHSHSFTAKVTTDAYLKSEATCTEGKLYYYSCECGEKGEETFVVGKPIRHDNTAQVEAEEYVKTAPTCQSGGVYYKSCTMCGLKSAFTFTSDTLGDHTYAEEVPDGKYLKTEATETSSAVYYKSCVCGLVGTETFSYGDPLRDYTDEEKAYYKPNSLTVTLYDTEASLYGFTYNTYQRPLRPVIQVSEDPSFMHYAEYPAWVEEATSYSDDDKVMTYYIVKAEVRLESSKTYTYRAYDKYVKVGTELTTLQTKDLSSNTFTFSHVADTQGYPQAFKHVLKDVVDTNDFLVHTGDVVENSKYESDWRGMLNGNFEYLSRIPVMAISGNHETTYKNGSDETYKHFNNKMVDQETELGYYYSFTYGNAKFIMLNTNRLTNSSLTTDQYNWLVEELEKNTAQWTIVAMHNPMYSAGNYGSDATKNYIALTLSYQLRGLFAEHGVDVVLQGHDHVVSRTKPIDGEGVAVTESFETLGGVEYSVNPKGVYYVMSGTTGGQTRAPYAEYNASLYSYAVSSKMSTWTEFTINGSKLTATVKSAENGTVSVVKQWGITKKA